MHESLIFNYKTVPLCCTLGENISLGKPDLMTKNYILVVFFCTSTKHYNLPCKSIGVYLVFHKRLKNWKVPLWRCGTKYIIPSLIASFTPYLATVPLCCISGKSIPLAKLDFLSKNYISIVLFSCTKHVICFIQENWIKSFFFHPRVTLFLIA